MTYEQALEFLNSRIPVGWKLGLDTMRQMLADLGDPHRKSKFVHIAGTNGKGSVASMLASIFKHAGYRTGLYTSPHLVDVRERIQLNGSHIDKKSFARLTQLMRPKIEKYNATYFEALTTLAFLYFARQRADMVLLETGLGGRLDATNIVDPELAIITSIDFDHTEHLGTTLADIAGEKAGIIKPIRPCLIGELSDDAAVVIKTAAQKQRAALYTARDQFQTTITNEKPGQTHFIAQHKNGDCETILLNMNGHFQVNNAALAMAACEILNAAGWRLGNTSRKKGLQHTVWPGRFQIVNHAPVIILDVAHNPAAMRQLVELLEKFYRGKKIYIVIGVLKDKDYGEMTMEIARVAHTVRPVTLKSERALPARELHSALQRFNIHVLPPNTVSNGINHALQALDHNDVLCITGSHYIVGEALMLTKGLTK